MTTTLAPRILGAPAALRPQDLLPPDQPLKPHPALRPWRRNAGIRALIFVGAFLLLAVLFVVGATFAAIFLSGVRDPQVLGPALGSYGSAILIVPTVLAYVLLGRWWEERRPIFELAWRRAPRGLLVGLALGAACMGASVGLLAILGAYRVQGLNVGYNPWPMIVTAGFGAAIVEEILFRGVLFRLVEDALGTWSACGISAVVFGLVHLSNTHATVQGALGIALEAGVLFAALYAFTRSLWVLMGLHFAWNVVQGPLLGIVVSGSQSGGGLLRSTLTGPEWLSGGEFGAEASLVTIALLTVVGVWVLVQVHRNGLVVDPFWVRRRKLAAAERLQRDAAGPDASVPADARGAAETLPPV